MKTESDIGSAIIHQFRVSIIPLFCMYVRFSQITRTLSSEVGHSSCFDLQIINLGKRLKDFGTATLNIDWPKETGDGKWLLYLMKMSSTGVDRIECSPKGEANPLAVVKVIHHNNVSFLIEVCGERSRQFYINRFIFIYTNEVNVTVE